jgi:hypothetical protein
MTTLNHRDIKIVKPPPNGMYKTILVSNTLVAVYDDGRIWDYRMSAFRQYSVDEYGYAYTSLGSKKVMVHQLILYIFKGKNERGQVARHIDGVKLNNSQHNLVWGTQKENWEDKRRHGTATVGEKSGRAKLTWSAVEEIKSSQESPSVLAKRYSVSADSIRNVKRGTTWQSAQ